MPLSAERTPCPHCGRETQTSSDGKTCVECWEDKTQPSVYAPGKRPPPPKPTPAQGGGSGGGCLDDLLGCVWPTAVLAAAVVLARKRAR